MNIFFDLDGTLINPFRRLYAIHAVLCRRYQISPLNFRKYVHLKQDHQSELSYLSIVNTVEKELYLNERHQLIEAPQYLRLDTLYPYVRKILQRLGRDNLLFLATVRQHSPSLVQQLAELNISQYFRKIYSPAREEFTGRPEEIKTRILSRALKENNAISVLVGDTEADILAARQLDVKCIVISGKMRRAQYLEQFHPQQIVSDIRFLVDALGK